MALVAVDEERQSGCASNAGNEAELRIFRNREKDRMWGGSRKKRGDGHGGILSVENGTIGIFVRGFAKRREYGVGWSGKSHSSETSARNAQWRAADHLRNRRSQVRGGNGHAGFGG